MATITLRLRQRRILAGAIASLSVALACGPTVNADAPATDGESDDGGADTDDPGETGPSGCEAEVLANDANGAAAPLILGDRIYWSTGDGEVMQYRDGAATPVLSGLDGSVDLAAGAGFVVLTTSATVQRFDEGSGAVEVLATDQANAFSPVVHGDTVYWLNAGSGILAGSLWRADPGAAPVLVLDQLGFPRAAAADDNYVYVIAQQAALAEIALEGPLIRIAHDTFESPEVVHAGVLEPSGLSVTGDAIYWIEQVGEAFSYPGHVRRWPKSGGEAQTLALIEDALGVAVAADDRDAVYTVFDDTGSYANRVSIGDASIQAVSLQPASTVIDVALSDDAIVLTTAWSPGQVPLGTPSITRFCRDPGA